MSKETREPASPSSSRLSQIEIRTARADELAGIGELTATTYVAAGYVNPESHYLTRLRDAVSRASEAELLVVLYAGEPAGTVTYCPHGSAWAQITVAGEAEFRMLAVVPAARGLGLGEALVRRCVDRAREDGCHTLRLSTEPMMHAAHRIYRRMGFVRTPGHDWQPEPGVELMTFALAL